VDYLIDTPISLLLPWRTFTLTGMSILCSKVKDQGHRIAKTSSKGWTSHVPKCLLITCGIALWLSTLGK